MVETPVIFGDKFHYRLFVSENDIMPTQQMLVENNIDFTTHQIFEETELKLYPKTLDEAVFAKNLNLKPNIQVFLKPSFRTPLFKK